MWRFEEKVAAGFGIAFVLLTAVGMAAYRNNDTHRITQSNYLRSRSHSVIEHSERLLSEMKDAETGQRGFVITGDESYLEPYATGSAAVADTISELRELTAENPVHQKRFAEMEALVAGKLEELRQTIGLRRARGFEGARKDILRGEGKRQMDELRGVIAQIDRCERDLLKLRIGEVEAAASRSRNAIAVGTVLSLIIAMAAAFIFIRSLTSQTGPTVRRVGFRTAQARLSAPTCSQRTARRPSVQAPSSRC